MVVFCYPSDCYSTVCTQHSACMHTPHYMYKFYFFLKFCSTPHYTQILYFFLIFVCKNGALYVCAASSAPLTAQHLQFFFIFVCKNGAT